MITLKTLRGRPVLIAALCLVTLFVVFCVSLPIAVNSKKPWQASVVLTSNVNYVLPAELPVRLKIPKISVDGDIEQVGLNPKDNLNVPKSYANGGWYKHGPRPGQPGSAVIGGHFGRANDKPAIFDNLHLLQKGDKIFVTDKSGAKTTFIVTGSRSYEPGENATAVFRSSPETARLNLITCQGDWDTNRRTYTSRLVVFSEKK